MHIARFEFKKKTGHLSGQQPPAIHNLTCLPPASKFSPVTGPVAGSGGVALPGLHDGPPLRCGQHGELRRNFDEIPRKFRLSTKFRVGFFFDYLAAGARGCCALGRLCPFPPLHLQVHQARVGRPRTHIILHWP